MANSLATGTYVVIPVVGSGEEQELIPDRGRVLGLDLVVITNDLSKTSI